ncbi:MAG: outer membrane beta-barrel protein [Bacteroidota bacterium]|nr:outer membrane beta-barrel protein [Bacteroidota bacterium]
MIQKILLSTLILFSFNALAQETRTPVMGKSSFGIYGGVNFQNINGKDANGDKLSNSIVTKFNVGVNEEIPLGPDFYLQLGLQYIGKGATEKLVYRGASIVRNINISYLEIPVNIVYKPLVGKGHFLLGFGPYFGYGIMGKIKYTGGYNGNYNLQFANKVVLGDQSNPDNTIYYKHLDAGANVFFGYEFTSKVTLTFNSQLGLVNINPNYSNAPNSKIANKNTGFGLTVGYRF